MKKMEVNNAAYFSFPLRIRKDYNHIGVKTHEEFIINIISQPQRDSTFALFLMSVLTGL